jgi:predicted ATPase
VTFLVGENGSGKSTLIEAIAVAVGFNAEGGSRDFHFSTRAGDARADPRVMPRSA